MSCVSEIIDLINKRGYITIDQFMKAALSEYSDSYYRAKNPIGSDSDFITAPEISQMFGEMMAVFIYDSYLKFGSPKKINLVELGGGRGLLMRDILNSLKNFPIFDALEIYIFDINEVLIKEQKKNLENFDIKKNWFSNENLFPSGVTFFIANEFFDALPIKQYYLEKKQWKEIILKINPGGSEIIYDKISVTDILDEYLKYEYSHAGDGAIFEESPDTARFIKNICSHLKNNNGLCLIVDYGYDINPSSRKSNQFYPTLQAVKSHKYVSMLENIGDSDITAHIDFNYIKKITDYHKLHSFGAVTQGEFLDNLGIDLRLDILKDKNPDLQKILDNQYNRLTSKDMMGDLFKVLCFTNLKNFQPLGFDI